MDCNRGRSPSRVALVLLVALVAISAAAPDVSAQYFGRNKIQYENFHWKVLNTPHFEIFFYDGADDLAARAAVIAEDAYVRLSDVFDHEFAAQIPFVLYDSPNDFQQTNISDGIIGEGTGGFSEPLRNRVVLPYPGDNAAFVHVINHELVHVFMFDIAFHSTAKGAARRALFPIPLWFAEGAAEWFATGWDRQTDMWMRDATIYDWIVPLDRIYGGFQVYKEGQSAMRYMAHTYGEEKVIDFFKAVGRTRDVNRALELVIGLDTKTFSKRWEKALKLEYWPLYSDKQEAEAIGRRMTDHAEDQHYFNQQAALSPDGSHIAFFSDRDGLVNLYLMNAVDGEVERKLATGYRSNQFLSFHSFESGISFSSDSERVCFVAKSGSDETLYVVGIENGKILQDIPLKMDIARSPAWSPTGDRVVLSGTRAGQTDLYLVDLLSGDLRRLTDNLDSEFSPAWYPDGERIVYSAYPNTTRNVGFISDEAGAVMLTPVDFASTSNLEHDGASRDLIALDLRSGESEVVLSTEGNDTDPVMVDEDTIVFVSDVSGISNLYSYDLRTRRVQRFTDVLTGIFRPSVSVEADRLSFVAFDNAGFDLFLIENFREYVAENQYHDSVSEDVKAKLAQVGVPSDGEIGKLLTVDDLLPRGMNPVAGPNLGAVAVASPDDVQTADAKPADVPVAEVAAVTGENKTVENADVGAAAEPALPKPSASPEGLGFGSDSSADDEGAAPDDEPLKPVGSVEKYSPRFSLDPLGGGAVGGVFYSSGLGLGLANIISMSDLLGNHRMQFLVNFYGSIKYSDLAATYFYLKRRINYGVGVFHYRNFFNSNYTTLGEVFDRSQLFTERNYGLFGIASAPLNHFKRIDLELQAFTTDRTFYARDSEGFYVEAARSKAQLIQPSLSFVHDSAFYGPNGPVTGSRWLVNFSPAVPLSDSSVNRVTSFMDYRKYFILWSRNSLAFRMVGAMSNGSDPRQFVVGGPFTLRGWDTFDFEETDETGASRYHNLVGERMVMMNMEYRFPFVDYLIFGWPGRFGLGSIGGVVFFDVGSAFNDHFRAFSETNQGNLQLHDLNADFGLGLRARFGWLPLKFDWGWKTSLAQTSNDVQFSFSIGPEF